MMQPNNQPSIGVTLKGHCYYFRSISELKDCKHGGYINGSIHFSSLGGNNKVNRIELSLVPHLEIKSKPDERKSKDEKKYLQLRNQKPLHCNLLYISSTSEQKPNLNASAWRVILQRNNEGSMMLSTDNHVYLEQELNVF